MGKRDENIFYLLSLAPWWVGVCVAAIVYFSLKFVIPSIQFENPVFKGMAPVASQFAWVAAFFLLPAGISAFESMRKRKLLDKQSGIESIRKLSWKEFEELLAEAYRRQGYKVQENHGAGPDGGIDLIIRKDGNWFIVQCKHWRSVKVGVNIVREMFGLMTSEGADGVIIVTSGMFTQEAQNFAAQKAIDLVDGNQLVALLRDIQGSNQIAVQSETKDEYQKCPRCGSKMVIREAKRGQNIGEKFWGCSNFPSCRHTEKCISESFVKG